MTRYVVPAYSRKHIVAAGRALAGEITAVDEGSVEVFRIAHNWRSAHVLPMRLIRAELSRKARAIQRGAVTAARLKRMRSIRRKLRKTPLSLYQLQDIGGCRAILESMAEVESLVRIYKDGGTKHRIARENDYIEAPKADGYRSHHIVLKFQGTGDSEIYNRQFFELQFRTRLQHAWATAVEAVGLVRSENLKAGEGDSDWLRFFQIMASEFAIVEQRPTIVTVPDSESERRSELLDLNAKLDALKRLQNYNLAIHYTENWVTGGARFFLIQYDNADMSVTVQPFFAYSLSAERYIEQEKSDATKNSVLVEVDKVQDLKAAYPNYFLDVRIFTDHLRSIVTGESTAPIIDRGRRSINDLSWIGEQLKSFSRSR